MNKTEIGVFCGTFNPIHWGHLMLAEFACDQFELDRVIVVTSPNPPHRHQDLLDAEQRHELVVAACQGNGNLQPSRLELDRTGPSYTVDTLRAISEQEAKNAENVRLNLIVGQDNLPFLKEWHDSATLFTLCRILVAPRTSTVTQEDIAKELPSGVSFELIDFPQVPVSSSIIRARIRADKTIMYLVPPQVANIIESRGLYMLNVSKAVSGGRMRHARHTRQN